MNPQLKGKKSCILVTTCIGRAFAYLLKRSDAFFQDYELFEFITERQTPLASEFDIPDELLDGCSLFLSLTPGWADWGNEKTYHDLLARVPAHVPRLSLPYPVFLPLWPYHSSEPRNDLVNDRPSRFSNRPICFPYGDAFVQSLLRQGLGKAEIIRKYLAIDWDEAMDLDALLAKVLDIQRAKERHTDVKIIDFIEGRFREKQLFVTMNHIGNDLAIHIVDQILEKIGLEPLDPAVHRTISQLMAPELPIHPGIIDHFNLRYVTKDHRYRLDDRQLLTFEDYLGRYIDFA